MFEEIKETAQILSDVLEGRAFASTLLPKCRNKVTAEIIRADGSKGPTIIGYNSRVNAGSLAQALLMGSAAGTPFNYLALSTAILTPAAGDTTLASEITSGTNTGLVRVAATYGGYTAPGSLGGSASYTLTHSFTSAASTTVQSAALFNASSGGSLFVESNLSSSATLANGDVLNITWQINI